MSVRKTPYSTRNKKEREPKFSKQIIREQFLFILDNTGTKVFVTAKESSSITGKVELNLLNVKCFSEQDLHELEFFHQKPLVRNSAFNFIKANIYLIKKRLSLESISKLIKLEAGECLYQIDYDEYNKAKGKDNIFYQTLDLEAIKADFQKPILMHKFLRYGIDAYKKYLKNK